MVARNRPERTLESWKQIAAYLERSERTVRRWESTEGLPVHRRSHAKQDTVFAYRHELDRWWGKRTRMPGRNGIREEADAAVEANGYLREHEAITRTMHLYVAGARAGNSELMRPAFHPEATISGYCLGGVEYGGSVEHVFAWIDANGAAPGLQAQFARIEVIRTIAVVHLEVKGWSGKQVGTEARSSDVFTLVKVGGDWKITHKLFDWQDDE